MPPVLRHALVAAALAALLPAGDHGFHNLLDRPRDAPWRTAIGAALAAWVVIVS